MKKLIYSAAALAMAFFAASCQQENLEPVAQESTVTFSVELPGVQTKAIGDGFNVDQLVYEVWKTEAAGETVLNGTDDEGKANATRLYQETAVMTKVGDEQKTVISLNLVHDQNYTILFWAQNSKAIGKEGAETPAYVTSDLTAVTYAKEVTDGSYLSNNENMAAFYGVAFLEKEEVEVPSTRRVELKRPFAQLNIGTKNTAEEYEIAMTQSKVKISNVPTVFDVAQNTPASPAVSDYESFEFSYAALPTNPETLRVNDIPYHYVAMNYIFAGSRNVTVEYNIDATLTAKDSGATTEATVNNTVIEVPLKENYRTNIIGNLITSTTQYEVVIDASWDDVDADNWDGNVEEVWDERYIQEPKMVNGVYEISLASELAWLAAKVNGMPYVDPETNSVKYEAPVKFAGVTFKLVEDIDLVGEDNDQAGYEDYELTWIPIGATGEFQGIFDGQNHTISNLVVKTEGTTPAGLFGKVKSATVKNVTVVNADVQGHGSAAVIVAHGVCAKIEECHVEGATVVSTPYEKDHANNVGGIIGYLSGENVGYVKNSSVKNATITGYRKVGGIAGVANQTAEVTGNKVENATITADQTPEYKTEEKPHLGKSVGYKHANATVADNDEDTKVTLIHKINSVAEFINVAEGAFVTVSSGVYDLTGDVTAEGKAIQILNGEVVINGHDFAITSGSSNDYAIITKGNGSSLTMNADLIAKGGGYAVTGGANLTINDGIVDITKATASAGRYNVYTDGEGTTVTINGGTFKLKTSDKRAYIYANAGTTVYVNGGTFGKPSTRSDYKAGILGTGTVIITGGTFGFDPTKWLKHGYVAKKVDNNWVVEGPATTTDEFQAALKDAKPGDVVYVTGSGVMPSSLATSTPGELTIEGVSEDSEVSFNTQAGSADGGLNCYADGMDLVFKNIKIVSPNTGSAYSGGFGRAKSVTFINCEYVGQYRAGSATTKFIECTIDPQTSYIYTDYANVDFEDCVFNCSEGKGVQVYNDANSSETVVNVTDCEFIAAKQGATWDNKPVTAVDINSNGEKFTVNIANSTATGFPEGLVSGETIFNIKGGAEYVTVMVDGLQWLTKDAWKDADGNVVVYSSEALQYALDNTIEGQNMIHLAADIVDNVTAVQKLGVKVVINGNGNNYDGMITVDGKSMAYASAGLTIKNLTFNASSITGDACIRLGDGTDATRYTSNVTVQNCTFDVPGAVGVKSYTGGDKNLTISGCTATANAHSLLQAAGIDGILVQGCTINSKNGMNFNQSDNVTIKSCEAVVKGYAARFGASSGTTGVAEAYAITNSTLKSACNDGDAVIILRGTADLATLNIDSATTLEGTTPITNNADGAKVLVDGREYVADGLTKDGLEYYVSNANGLAYFSNKTVADGTVITLTTDINFNGADFKAIAAGYSKSFTFNGNNHSIKNVNLATCSHNTVGAASLFFCYPGGTINVNDLVVDGAVSEGGTYVGTILGYTQGNATIKNVTVKNSSISGVKKIGGLVGFVEASTSSFVAEDCKIINTTVVATEKQAGTIIGYNAKPATLRNCTVDSLSTATAPEYCDGGIRSTDPAQAELTIE